jgi:hypothetical protein
LRKKDKFFTQLVQFSSDIKFDSRFDSEGFRDFLYAQDYGKPRIFSLEGKKRFSAFVPISIDLYITGDNGFNSLHGKVGLQNDKNDKSKDTIIKDKLCWRVFSAQNGIIRKIRKFYYDSFVIFSLNKNLFKSSLNLYCRDSRKSDYKFKKKKFSAFSNDSNKEKKILVSTNKYDNEIERLNNKISELKEQKEKLEIKIT